MPIQNQIEDLIFKHKWNAVMVYNLDIVKELYEQWVNLMPNINPYYAVKCNSNLKLLHKLSRLGSGFDCASKREIKKILQIRKEPEKIVFSNPCKYDEDIAYAKKSNVSLLVFDSLAELEKIKNIHPNATLILRIYANDKLARHHLSKKYGAYRSEWKGLYEKAKRLNLKISGISFHIGSGAKNEKTYIDALEDARECALLGENYGYKIRIIDIGGGFSNNTINRFSKAINRGISKYFKDEDVKLIAEPGRYFAETVSTLYTLVFGEKQRNKKYSYFVSSGLYGCLNCKIHGEVVPRPKVLYMNNKSNKIHPSIIYGPTCDSSDIILKKINIPELHIGDYIVWDNMGAYTIVSSTDFNGINENKPMAIYIEDDEITYEKIKF